MRTARATPQWEIAIDGLEHEAAALIRARCDRTLAPVIAAHDAALREAHRLLGLPPTVPSDRAQRFTAAFTEATREAVAEHRRAGRKP